MPAQHLHSYSSHGGFYHFMGVQTPFDPAYSLVTSPVPLLTPFVLSSVRLILGAWTLSVSIVQLVWSIQVRQGNGFLTYFTHLSYIGLSAYFFATGGHGLVFAIRARRTRRRYDQARGAAVSEKKQDSADDRDGDAYAPIQYPLQEWPRPLQALQLLMTTTIRTFPLLITIVFWALLATPQAFSKTETAFSNISTHILNSVFALFEIFLTNTPPLPWLHLPFCIFILGLYLALAYISHATIGGGYYPYTFLDPSPPHTPGRTAGYIIGNFVGFAIIFLVVRYLVFARIWIVLSTRARRVGKAGVGAESRSTIGTASMVATGEASPSAVGRSGRRREALDEWEVV